MPNFFTQMLREACDRTEKAARTKVAKHGAPPQLDTELRGIVDRVVVRNSTELWAIFRNYDQNGDGYLSEEEFRKLFSDYVKELAHHIPSLTNRMFQCIMNAACYDMEDESDRGKLRKFGWSTGHRVEKEVQKFLAQLVHTATWRLNSDFTWKRMDENGDNRVDDTEFMKRFNQEFRFMFYSSIQFRDIYSRLNTELSSPR